MAKVKVVKEHNCGTCKFSVWAGVVMEELGFCKRYPPRENDEPFRYPQVRRNDWCGEWKAR